MNANDPKPATDKLVFVIPGTPIAKKRPRFFRRGWGGGAYNCQTTEEGRFMWEVHRQLPRGFAPLARGVAVELECYFYLPIPKAVSRKQRLMMEGHIIKHTKKPDLDNCLKFVKDCMNKVVWYDDSAVVREVLGKEYSDNPRTEIVVRVAQGA